MIYREINVIYIEINLLSCPFVSAEKGWVRKDIKPELFLAIFNKVPEITGIRLLLTFSDRVIPL